MISTEENHSSCIRVRLVNDHSSKKNIPGPLCPAVCPLLDDRAQCLCTEPSTSAWHASAKWEAAAIWHAPTATTTRHAASTAITRHGHRYLSQLAKLAREAFPDQPWLALAALYQDSLSAHSTPEQLAWTARNAFRLLKLHSGLSPAWGRRRPRAHASRLRIAYVAGQQHERLLQRVLASHDPAQVEVFVFTSLRLSGLPAHIHCQPLDLDQLEAACAANQIDVLIDAGGLQPFEGQYALLERYARRLAPVQVGWLGSWGSAGGL
ncbi:MAG TPA: hypothetical protein PLS60_10720, partial [Arenimonas sp.]|nr:hypothetical protein [Arenimonas sp.]